MSAPIPTLVSGGIYKIISVSSATIITLSSADSTTIQGYHDKNERSQKWLAENLGGDKWTLKSLVQHDGKDVYLAYPSSFTQGSLVTGVPSDAVQWDITQWSTRGGAEYRIWVPGGTELLVDLADYDPADGAKIQLWKSYDTTAQFWLFQRILD